MDHAPLTMEQRRSAADVAIALHRTHELLEVFGIDGPPVTRAQLLFVARAFEDLATDPEPAAHPLPGGEG